MTTIDSNTLNQHVITELRETNRRIDDAFANITGLLGSLSVGNIAGLTPTRGAIIYGAGATPAWSVLAAGAANKILKMGATEPAWSSLVAGDIPPVTNSMLAGSIDLSKLVSGTPGDIIVCSPAGVPNYVFPAGDVGISTSGTTTIGTGKVINDMLAGSIALAKLLPSSSGNIIVCNAGGVPTYIAMTGDVTINNLGATSLATVGVAKGGTGITSYTVGDLLYASGVTTLSKLADVAAGQPLLSGGVTTAPAYAGWTLSGTATKTYTYPVITDTLAGLGTANVFSALNTFTSLKLSTGLIYPSADSATALRITKADATTVMMDFDTTNSQVLIGATPATTDRVLGISPGSDSRIPLTLYQNSATQSASLMTWNDSSDTVIGSILNNGSMNFSGTINGARILGVNGSMVSSEATQMELIQAQATIKPSAVTLASLYGMIFLPTINNSSTNITGVNSLYSRVDLGALYSGTISSLRLVFAALPIVSGGSITSLAGLVAANMTAATNNTNLLLGTGVIPAGNWSIYNSSTYANSFAGTLAITDATDATSTTAASVMLTGGLAVAKKLYVGSSVVLTTKITTYNNIATAGNGVASVYGVADLTAQGGNTAATTLYSVPAGGAGTYLVTIHIAITRAATSSSTLPDSRIIWTDADSSVTRTVAATATSAGNATTVYQQISFVINAKLSTNIQYDIGQVNAYASSGATSMQFAYHARCVFLG